MSNELVLNQLERLYERLGEPKLGDNQVWVGKNFSKAELYSELDNLAFKLTSSSQLLSDSHEYVRTHQGELELDQNDPAKYPALG